MPAVLMSSPLLTIRGLRKRHGNVEAVRDLSFDVQAGEIFGLLGPNGAGKTTTLECITGLHVPDAGEILVCGIDVQRQPRAAREQLGVSLQHTALQDKITPREALALFASFYRTPVSVDSLLERFALTPKADVAFDTLSGGQRQRLALALAFVNHPRVVVLDEPTAGLDPQARHDLQEEILGLKREGHTLLLATHYLEEAQALCDRVAIVHQGKLMAVGAPRDLIERSSTHQSFRIEISRPLSREHFSTLPEIVDLEVLETTVHFRTLAPLPALTALTALLSRERVELVDLRVQKATLENVFLQLTAESRNR
jgi:ABC-2 type transport system ATP-binding protein